MNLKIAIASGKGGTGKTTVALNLFRWFSEHTKNKVQLVDCDVEEPNDRLFFKDALCCSDEVVNQLIPFIGTGECTFCRKCVEYCEFNAVVVIPPAHFAEINENLCHSCGACLEACSYGAITEVPKEIGKIKRFDIGINTKLIEGKLKIGSAKQTMLIKSVKKSIDNEFDITLFDAPPGTSCPVVETISSSDFVVLVTEPTPFGLYDLKLMVELLKDMNLKYGVVVNKAGIGNEEVYQFLDDNDILLLGKIPFNQDYVNQYAEGDIFQDIPDVVDQSYNQIVDKITETIAAHEGNNSFKR
jgi:MinD superfamily P-loop ATPase